MTCPTFPRALVLCSLLLGSGPAGASDAAVPCPDQPVTVAHADAALTDRICRATALARDRLGACGLVQTRPIAVEVIDVIDVDHVACIAAYDCSRDVLRVLPPDRLAAPGVVQAPFGDIPAEALFDSLVVHELTHAFLQQTAAENPSRIDHEYLAYAFQLDVLPEEDRARILAVAPADGPPSLDRINIGILMFAPAAFAARAWRYFDGPGGRCDSVADVLAGRLSGAHPDP